MTTLRRLFPLVVIAAMIGSIALVSATASATTPAAASKKGKAKGKKCPKGKKLVTVTKNGKKVKVCKKKPPKMCRASTSCALPPENHGLFPDPGKTLEEAEAKEWLKPYLPNSTFTDCVTGWPSCGGFENRYSHSTDATFYQCWLRPTSGSDVKSVGEYGVQKAKVNPDGSWLIQEIVGWYGHYNLFEWSVSDSGVVTGANQSDSGGAPEQIGPLQYVGGVAKDCSY
ncbi:MAG TPA: hypothetical protein VGO66_02130 [Solirubrobacterales bacterium]|jgi:hypothetical protein|nr:hypothetical protein [Solirubrobacterales bacterium]